LKAQGYFGMIFPAPFLNDISSYKLRKHLIDNTTIKIVLEFPESTKVFAESGVTQAVSILIYKNQVSSDNYVFKILSNISRKQLDVICPLVLNF